IGGQGAALVVLILQRENGEKEAVVDDDDVAFPRPLVHQRDEAAAGVGTLLAAAQFGPGIHPGPNGGTFGQALDFGAVAHLAGLFPLADNLEIGYFLQAGEHRSVFGVVDLLAAGVIVAPLHVADLEGAREVLLKKGNVFEKKLLLEGLGPGGDDDPLAGEQGGHQVGQRFAGPGAGLHDQVALIGEGALDGFGHLHLAGTELVIWVPLGQRPAPAKKLTGVGAAGLSGHRDALSLTRVMRPSWRGGDQTLRPAGNWRERRYRGRRTGRPRVWGTRRRRS